MEQPQQVFEAAPAPQLRFRWVVMSAHRFKPQNEDFMFDLHVMIKWIEPDIGLVNVLLGIIIFNWGCVTLMYD